MSTLNKYTIFQCDTCKRQTEIRLDGLRPDPLRCNITNKCRGKLARVGESLNKKFLFTPPVTGLQDFIPRGTVLPTITALTSDPLVALSTGMGMLTMAVLTKRAITATTHVFTAQVMTQNAVRAGNFIIGVTYTIASVGSTIFTAIGAPNNNVGTIFTATGAGTGTGTASTYTLIVDSEPNTFPLAQNVKLFMNIFPISPSVLQSTTYTYVVSGAVTVIGGPDNSPSASTLRFSASNKISVYVNGVQADPSTYLISVSAQNITFTPSIYESNNVINVIVYNDLTANVTATSLIPLEFDVLDPTATTAQAGLTSPNALLSGNAWGNYSAVSFPDGTTNYLLHCTDLSAVVKDSSYGVKNVQVLIGANTVDAGNFVVGTEYQILSVGTTDFTLIGASANAIGVTFTATGPGIGTGTAQIVVTPIDVDLSSVNFMLAKDPYNFQDKELNVYLNGERFTSSFSFTYGQEEQTGIYEFSAPLSTFTQLLHPLVPTAASNPLDFNVTPSTGTSATTVVQHKYVLGPT